MDFTKLYDINQDSFKIITEKDAGSSDKSVTSYYRLIRIN